MQYLIPQSWNSSLGFREWTHSGHPQGHDRMDFCVYILWPSLFWSKHLGCGPCLSNRLSNHLPLLKMPSALVLSVEIFPDSYQVSRELPDHRLKPRHISCPHHSGSGWLKTSHQFSPSSSLEIQTFSQMRTDTHFGPELEKIPCSPTYRIKHSGFSYLVSLPPLSSGRKGWWSAALALVPTAQLLRWACQAGYCS